MNARHTLAALLLLSLGSTCGAAFAQPAMSAAGEPAWVTKSAAPVAWRGTAAAPVARQVYGELDIARIAEMQQRNDNGLQKRYEVGVARLANETTSKLQPLRWQDVAGGSVARIEVKSPDAVGLRVGLMVSGFGDGMELRFAGSEDPTRLVAMTPGADVKQLVDAQGIHWTPITDGEVQVIELFAPKGVALDAIRVSIPLVSHLMVNSRVTLMEKIGESQACEVDVACRVNTLGQNFVNAKNAVARMAITVSGGTGFCTGTLLNDTVAATQVPYFFSGNHCIENQAEANTLVTLWNYEATSCGSGVSAPTTQVVGGADILYASNAGDIQAPPYEGSDALLLRLRNPPPATAFFAGWDATVVANGASVLAIHHPNTDIKKASVGQQLLLDTNTFEAGWTSGTTEGGSSGSGLFTLSGAGYQLRGGLFGGGASCSNSGNLSNPSNFDIYSRLDRAYPSIQPFLAPTTQAFGPSAGRNYTGAWYVPSESGWGLTAFQFDNADKTLFVMFFIYDQTGKAQWFELGGSWTATDARGGDMLQSNGPPWGPTFNPALRTFTVAGIASITFTSATTANLQLTVNGATRNVAIVKL